MRHTLETAQMALRMPVRHGSFCLTHAVDFYVRVSQRIEAVAVAEVRTKAGHIVSGTYCIDINCFII